MSDLPPLASIRVFRDGDCMCALLGPNLQEGESEFVGIDDPGGKLEQKEAGEEAALQLEVRLGIAHLNLPRVACDGEGFELGDDDSDEIDWWKR